MNVKEENKHEFFIQKLVAIISWNIRILLFLFLSSQIIQLSATETQTDPLFQKKRILILHAYSPGYHWADRMMKGVLDTLNNTDGIELYVEFMDTKRHASPEYFEQLKEIYQYKYKNTPIDIIVSCDDNALDFLLTYRDEVFGEVPVSFCGINDYQPERIIGYKGYTGVSETYDAVSNVEMILRDHPNVKEIVVISDLSESAKALISHLNRAQPMFEDRVDFKYLTYLPKDELSAELENISQDAVIIWTILLKFPNKTSITVHDSLKWIKSKCDNPIYSLWDVVGMGVVGGVMTTPHYQGQKASEIALRILNGTPLTEIPVSESPMIHKFDYKELKRLGLTQNKYPKNSIIINDPYVFFKEHKWSIVSSIVFVLVLITLLIVLGSLNRRSKKAEQSLRITNNKLIMAKEKAEESDRLKSAFLSNLSHEIRTPMNGILGFAQLIKEEELKSNEQMELIDAIFENGELMINLIEELLDISKIESGNNPIQNNEFSLNELIDQISSIFRMRTDQKHIELKTTIESADNDFIMISDRQKLETILIKLMENAIKYTPSGTISLSCICEQKKVTFYISDTGIGIKEDKLNLIFERFRRLDDERYSGLDGVGLGLSITKALVELLGGKMFVTSTYGKGSTFGFTIPNHKS